MNDPTDDPAGRALNDLRAQLDRTIVELRAASERLEQLAQLREAGHSWLDIVANEDRPLVVERVTHALDDLGEAGSRFRREEALALQLENVSITRIGRLFGVSRQRISTLLREHRTTDPAVRQRRTQVRSTPTAVSRSEGRPV